ncbi:RNA-binding protein 28 [Araneus ventricosus]|uniref:RNA-binding protein 28 n=1 Tax=Araneus ventricosus TaxID=182803 RepID=A0A4Y2BL82_ARAVE|nr:RNA-binding protein 28 [Araneus ventricosus]
MINIKSTASDNVKTAKGGHSNSSKNVGKLEQRLKKRPKLKKRKRLIIRNLSFKANEDDLKEIFSKYGKVTDVKIPLKEDGKKRGFAFVEFEDTKSLIQAMKTMNYKEIQGRKVAIDYAVDKTSYKLKLQGLSEEKPNSSVTKKEIKDESDSEIEIKSEKDSDSDENDKVKESESENENEEDEDEKRLNAFLKEFDSGAEALTNSHIGDDKSSSSESSSEESDADEEVEENYIKKEKVANKKDKIVDKKEKAIVKKERSNDVNDGKTVFLRNVSFATTEESLEEEMAKYGEYEYCVLVRDQLTDHPKGSAFVKFKRKETAEKLIEQSDIEPGVVVDGRRLACVIAVSKDAIPTGKPQEKKDKRNLNLLRVGIIVSEDADGMSKADMTKRTQLEMVKKAKLRNVNFFVSDKRLLVHNLPQTYTDSKLRQLFKKAAGPGSVITEARLMKEFKKMDAQGVPLSKGFGFVSFEKHDDAMKALNVLNNNPNIFTAQRRPIVEFSIENKVALLTKERRKEKIQMRNKRRTEEKNERKLKQAGEDKAEQKSPQKGKRQKNKKKQLPENKRKKNQVNEIAKGDSPEKSPKKVCRRSVLLYQLLHL